MELLNFDPLKKATDDPTKTCHNTQTQIREQASAAVRILMFTALKTLSEFPIVWIKSCRRPYDFY